MPQTIALKTKKKPLTPAQKLVAGRLKAAWNARKEVLLLKQDVAAEALGITQGALGHYLNGVNAVGFEALFRLADLLRVHPYEIDPTFRDQLPGDLRKAVDAMVVTLPEPLQPFSYPVSRSVSFPLHEK